MRFLVQDLGLSVVEMKASLSKLQTSGLINSRVDASRTKMKVDRHDSVAQGRAMIGIEMVHNAVVPSFLVNP